MARKLTNEENEKLTWQDMKYGKKNEKTCEMKNTYGRTWSMVRNSEKLNMRNTQETLNMRNTLQDMDCGKKTEKRGNLETNIVLPGMWQETLKNMKNKKCTLQDLEYGEKTEKRGK